MTQQHQKDHQSHEDNFFNEDEGRAQTSKVPDECEFNFNCFELTNCPMIVVCKFLPWLMVTVFVLSIRLILVFLPSPALSADILWTYCELFDLSVARSFVSRELVFSVARFLFPLSLSECRELLLDWRDRFSSSGSSSIDSDMSLKLSLMNCSSSRVEGSMRSMLRSL